MNSFPEVTVSSFSFKTGTPAANVVMDVRFLPDPRQLEESNPFITGQHGEVEKFIVSHNCFEPFFNAMTQKIVCVLQDTATRGQSKLSIAFGCTAGKHRSVFVAEYLTRWLRHRFCDMKVNIQHRDMVCNESEMLLDLDQALEGNNMEVQEPSFPGIGPLMTCTYHPDTHHLNVVSQPEQPQSCPQMNNMLLSGLKNIKMLRQKRQRNSLPNPAQSQCFESTPTLIA
eukprot:CAMPEP_0196739262 /NCGR_PEP_ID=MMETSP1091-20130531/20811_1 /TAXON_ID=302021 /ORGANISM="Rhodomonas sp., Strain CCMP768" /LENGTH=226 /DNA_ID=CAMNT_0042083691 /DNA_START=176 /DNA_END=856 /DNA_ORIENTATION=-